MNVNLGRNSSKLTPKDEVKPEVEDGPETGQGCDSEPDAMAASGKSKKNKKSKKVCKL
jgi:hypothetical protein